MVSTGTRANIYLDEDLLNAAKQVGLNVSAVCRQALAAEVEAYENAKLPEFRRVEAFQEGRPVAFLGKSVATRDTAGFGQELTAYLTPKSGLVFVVDDFEKGGSDRFARVRMITAVYTELDEYFEESERDHPDGVEFEQKIAEACGRIYFEFLDI